DGIRDDLVTGVQTCALPISGRPMTIGGQYVLGTGFLGLGVVLASEADFFRMFPQRPPDAVNLGLVTLKPGADPDRVARQLRAARSEERRVGKGGAWSGVAEW